MYHSIVCGDHATTRTFTGYAGSQISSQPCKTRHASENPQACVEYKYVSYPPLLYPFLISFALCLFSHSFTYCRYLSAIEQQDKISTLIQNSPWSNELFSSSLASLALLSLRRGLATSSETTGKGRSTRTMSGNTTPPLHHTPTDPPPPKGRGPPKAVGGAMAHRQPAKPSP